MPDSTGFRADHLNRAYIEKDPTAELSYTVDWTQWLPLGTSIATSNFTVSTVTGDATPLAISNTLVINDQKCVVALTGGTAGEKYTVTNTIVTDNADKDSRRFIVVVKERYL